MNFRKYPVTITIIIICVLVTIGIQVCGLNEAEAAILFGAYYKPFILAGEWWRMLTVGFVHISFIHLLMNMTSLYSLGMALEPYLGKWKYLLILFVSVIGGSMFVFAGNGSVLCVGLSGGLYGLLACYAYLVYKHGGFNVPSIRNAFIRTFIINLIINFMPGISWMAHLGGFVTGILLSGVLETEDTGLRYGFLGAFVVLCICMMLLDVRNASLASDEIYGGTDQIVLQKYKDIGLSAHAEHMQEKLITIYTKAG